MMKLESLIHSAMDQHGVTLPKWKIKITNVEAVNFNWAKVTTEVFEPRKRKPTIIWEVAVYMPRNQVDFNKSTFYYC